MGWQAKAPAPHVSKVLSSNVGQALSPANSVIVAIFSRILTLTVAVPKDVAATVREPVHRTATNSATAR